MGSEPYALFSVGELIEQNAISGHKDGNHGSAYPRASEFGQDGIPFLTAKSLATGRVDIESAPRLPADRAMKLRHGFIKTDDVLLSHNATVGRVGIVPPYDGPLLIGTSLTYFRLNKSMLSPRYFAAYLSGVDFQNELKAVMSFSTRNQVPITLQKSLKISVPKLTQQNAIAHILGTLDDKIELNRQMNQTLEAMAQALFKSWFVDFDPVIDNALDAGNPIPEALQARAEQRRQLRQHAEHRPMPDSLRQQFPKDFVFTEEMGWVPEGWEPRPISNCISINPSVKLPKGSIAKFADMKALPTSGYAISDVIRKEFNGGAKFVKNDVLLARITPCLENGKTGIVDFLEPGEAGFGSTEFIVLRPNNQFSLPFVACLARDEVFRLHCMTSMVGSSGRQRVQNACFENYFVAVPPSGEVNSRFTEFTMAWFSSAAMNSKMTQPLTKLRDTLLPKLISGELRIPDAERLLAEAV